MMVTDFRCWWQNHYVGEFLRYVGDILKVLNRSPTHLVSSNRHKHRCNLNISKDQIHPITIEILKMIYLDTGFSRHFCFSSIRWLLRVYQDESYSFWSDWSVDL